MAAATRDRRLYRDDTGELRPASVGPSADLTVVVRSRRCRTLDVGRRPRPHLCRARILERAAADLDSCRHRHGVRVSVRDLAGARTALEIAGGTGGPLPLRR